MYTIYTIYAIYTHTTTLGSGAPYALLSERETANAQARGGDEGRSREVSHGAGGAQFVASL
jgi:hypothetical protein